MSASEVLRGFDQSFTIAIAQTQPSYWRDVLGICLGRIEAGQRALVPFDINPQSPDIPRALLTGAIGTQQASDVHFSLVAIRNVLRLMEDRLDRSEHSRLAELESEFRSSFPDAWNLRDILEHLLDYEAGNGKLQREGRMPTNESVPNLSYGSKTDPEAEIVLLFNFETRNIRVKEAIRKAIEIAEELTRLEREPSGGAAS